MSEAIHTKKIENEIIVERENHLVQKYLCQDKNNNDDHLTPSASLTCLFSIYRCMMDTSTCFDSWTFIPSLPHLHKSLNISRYFIGYFCQC